MRISVGIKLSFILKLMEHAQIEKVNAQLMFATSLLLIFLNNLQFLRPCPKLLLGEDHIHIPPMYMTIRAFNVQRPKDNSPATPTSF
jgi:hypothetical protein